MNEATDEIEDVPGAAPHVEAVESIEHTVVYPAKGTMTETAQALLKAAEDAGHPPTAVQISDGNFVVPAEVADAADLPDGSVKQDASQASDDGTGEDEILPPRSATKGAWQAFAAEHSLDVDESLKSDDYKDKVTEAFQSRDD